MSLTPRKEAPGPSASLIELMDAWDLLNGAVLSLGVAQPSNMTHRADQAETARIGMVSAMNKYLRETLK